MRVSAPFRESFHPWPPRRESHVTNPRGIDHARRIIPAKGGEVDTVRLEVFRISSPPIVRLFARAEGKVYFFAFNWILELLDRYYFGDK